MSLSHRRVQVGAGRFLSTVTPSAKRGGVGGLAGPLPASKFDMPVRQALSASMMTADELTDFARRNSMARAEAVLQPRGAYTLHKLLMASHDPEYTPRMVVPELLHQPNPQSPANRLVLAATRTLKAGTALLIDA
jgi:hypothetical protein